jgi:hypothetical protein
MIAAAILDWLRRSGPSIRPKGEDVTKRTDDQPALAGWQDEGGAVPSDAQHAAEDAHEQTEKREAVEASLDASYDSASRGEHRYPDAHQTESEQHARQERDALKRRLARRVE